MHKWIITFFDKLEDKIRISLSHYPIPYAFIGGVGVVLFWRGVWHTADMFKWFTGPLSTIVGFVILLLTGLVVSVFIGDSILLSSFNREKKLAEKTETEVRSEKNTMRYVVSELETIDAKLKSIESRLNKE